MSDGADIHSQFQVFLEEPSVSHFVSLRNVIIKSSNYDPYADSFSDIQKLIERGDFDDARRRLEAGMPNLLLSPRAHLILALLAEVQQSDKELSELERAVALTCAEAIAGTGDGTQERPYRVLRTSDEYDMLEFLGKNGGGQRLVHEGDRHFDVQICDGEEIWFDVSDAYNWLKSRHPEGEN